MGNVFGELCCGEVNLEEHDKRISRAVEKEQLREQRKEQRRISRTNQRSNSLTASNRRNTVGTDTTNRRVSTVISTERRNTIAPTLTIEMPSSESLVPDTNEQAEKDPFYLSEAERSKLVGYRLSLDASGHDMTQRRSNQSITSRSSSRSMKSISSNTSRRSMKSISSRTSTRKSTLTQQGRSGRRRSTITRGNNFFGKM